MMTMPDKIIQEIQKRQLEIETYRSHYLYKEARRCCEELVEYVRNNAQVTHKNAFLIKITKKIEQIDEATKAFNELVANYQMTPREQGLVRRLFGSGTDTADFEAATALLVFGQRAAALKAFHELLAAGTHRVAAAKNIIRCHLGDGNVQKAANEYLEWYKGDSFPPQELEPVRNFLQAVLTKKGYKQQLPVPLVVEEIEIEPEPEEAGGDLLSIILPFVNKKFRQQKVSLDVNFQREKRISCIVPKSKKSLLDFFKAGMVFPEVQINSISAITTCSVRLLEISKITEGQNAGDTTIAMEVMGS